MQKTEWRGLEEMGAFVSGTYSSVQKVAHTSSDITLSGSQHEAVENALGPPAVQGPGAPVPDGAGSTQ